MLGILPFVEDPDLSGIAAAALPQLLTPWCIVQSNPLLGKYILQFGQIHVDLWVNIFCTLDKYIGGRWEAANFHFPNNDWHNPIDYSTSYHQGLFVFVVCICVCIVYLCLGVCILYLHLFFVSAYLCLWKAANSHFPNNAIHCSASPHQGLFGLVDIAGQVFEGKARKYFKKSLHALIKFFHKCILSVVEQQLTLATISIYV